MTELKKQIADFLLSKGLIERSTQDGRYFIYHYCKGAWKGTDWAEVRFRNEYSDKIEVLTGYSGACNGDEGYDIASYKGTPKNFDDFLAILELTKFNDQLEKGGNTYKP